MNTGIATRRTLDIFPNLGMVTAVPAKELPLGASPDMLNMTFVAGRLRKRPGFTQFQSGNAAFGESVTGLASVQDDENATHLFAMTETDLWKYSAGGLNWTQMTGPALTGGATNLFTWEVSQNSLVFSQGVDQVQRMPFTGTVYAILNANCPAARYMTRGANRLLIASTLEGGLRKPFRVRRPVAADHTNWTGVGSGFVDLDEFPYHIKNIKKLGTRVAVYVEKAIWIGTRTGQAAAPLDFQPIVTGSGLYVPHTLKDRKGVHMFMGQDEVYEFNGATVTPISQAVQYNLFQGLNASVLQRMFAEILMETQEYLLFVCTGSNSTPDRIWVYNYGRGAWYPWSCSGPQCSTLHRLDSTITWDSISSSWDSYGVAWDSVTLSQSFPQMLTGHTDGKVYQWGLGLPSDAGAAIDCYWTSKQLHAGDIDPSFAGREVTLNGITFWYQSTGAPFSVDISYSTDGGQTWEATDTVSVSAMTTADRTFTVDRQVSGKTVTFRIRQNSATDLLVLTSMHPDLELRDTKVR